VVVVDVVVVVVPSKSGLKSGASIRIVTAWAIPINWAFAGGFV
jgi:hypothetical protein